MIGRLEAEARRNLEKKRERKDSRGLGVLAMPERVEGRVGYDSSKLTRCTSGGQCCKHLLNYIVIATVMGTNAVEHTTLSGETPIERCRSSSLQLLSNPELDGRR